MTRLSIVLLVAGCAGSVKVSHLNRSPRPLSPRAAEAVEVFLADPPAQPYVDVALLETERNFAGTEPSQPMLDALRERGGEIGCDAIVVRQVATRQLDSELHLSTKSIHASCIVYTEAAVRPL